jgi:hypothetical protein
MAAQPRWAAFAMVSAGAIPATLDQFSANIALTSIQHALHGSVPMLWVLNGQSIVSAALLVPAGRIADRNGSKGTAACARGDGGDCPCRRLRGARAGRRWLVVTTGWRPRSRPVRAPPGSERSSPRWSLGAGRLQAVGEHFGYCLCRDRQSSPAGRAGARSG